MLVLHAKDMLYKNNKGNNNIKGRKDRHIKCYDKKIHFNYIYIAFPSKSLTEYFSFYSRLASPVIVAPPYTILAICVTFNETRLVF